MVQNVCMRLKGERGASLSFALLLMLVCTMVTAVVLAASTASFGQFANRAAMDQRYYSVTSAGEALRKVLLNKEVTITVNATSSTDDEGNVTISRTLTYAPSNLPISLKAITDALFATGGPVDNFDVGGTSTGWPKTISMEINPGTQMAGIANADLKVIVDGSMDQSGTLWLDLHNNSTDKANTYHLGMALSPDIQQTWDQTVAGVGESEYTVTWGLLEIDPGRDVVTE